MFTNRPAISKEDAKRNLANALTEPNGALDESWIIVRNEVQKRLLSEHNGKTVLDNSDQMRKMIELTFNDVLIEKNLLLAQEARVQMFQYIIDDIVGYGPLEPLLKDNEITEIMVNGPYNVYVERFGTIDYTPVRFENEAHLRRIIDRIVAPIGRRVDESSPMVDARLPSGFRVNATIAPLSLVGPVLTIRKFAAQPFTVQELIVNESLTENLVLFLKGCIEARVNLVISGGTGSGKTTLLNLLSSFIPPQERIITIEDTAELSLHQKHVVRLEKRPPNIEGRGEVTIRQLVINALRMRPDRIIVGECRGGEALDMLQAMNTGHDGSMTTIHSNGPRDALRRIEIMVLMAGMDLPLKAIREQIAASIDLVVHLERLKDGTRKVVRVSEVQGLEGDTLVLQDIFVFEQKMIQEGRVIGKLKSTGLRPRFLSKLRSYSISLPDRVFEPD